MSDEQKKVPFIIANLDGFRLTDVHMETVDMTLMETIDLHDVSELDIERVNALIKPFMSHYTVVEIEYRRLTERAFDAYKIGYAGTWFINDKLCDERGIKPPAEMQHLFEKPLEEVTVVLPLDLFEGQSARWCREMGANVPDDVPNCAIIRGGAFTWVSLDFTLSPDADTKVKGTQNSVPVDGK